jgi:hypothetical protein
MNRATSLGDLVTRRPAPLSGPPTLDDDRRVGDLP